MAPVRVKLYGLFSMTKRRYLFQAVFSVVGAVLVLVGWCFAWPGLRPRLMRPDLPPSAIRTLIVAVMDAVPWILLAALAYQAAEIYLVLRVFARKQAQAAAPASKGAAPVTPPKPSP